MFDFDQELKMTFLEEAQNLIDDTEASFIALDAGDHSPELIDKIFRLAHNFKSSAATVGLTHLSEFGHTFEDVLTRLKKGDLAPDRVVCTVLLETLDHFRTYVEGLKNDLSYQHDTSQITAALVGLKNDSNGGVKPVPATISTSVATSEVEQATEPVAEPVKATRSAESENLKVNRRKLDTLLDLIGELVVNQSMIKSHKELGTLESGSSLQTLNSIEKIVHEIQESSLSLRMSPIAPVFQRLKRIARDASESMSKTITFTTEGEHVEVDKIVLDGICDPLVHLIRNAVDHGLESDEERLEAGKTDPATITLSAQQQEDQIVITLSDNGRGMDPARIIAKAKEKGLLAPDENPPNDEAFALIFRPGFSTKEQVTELSGRGVGMDVVHRAVDDLKGHIQIQTQLGEGTQFTISLPLSMSILTGMVVSIEEQKFVVPISQLVETVELKKFKIETSTNQGRMFNLRGEIIPIKSLSALLLRKSELHQKPGIGLVTVYNGKKRCFEIDSICGQQKIVLKKVGHEMQGIPGVVAGAILSTGEPGFVLNLLEFIESYAAERGAANAA